jgi:O-antigen/teichoic acid export membrane protein
VVSQVAATGEKVEWYLGNTFGLRVGLSVLGLAIIFGLASIWSLSSASRTLLYLMGLGNFFINCSLGLRWIFQARQRLQYEALLLLAFGMIYSITGLGFLAWQKEIAWIGVSYLLGGMVFFWTCYYLVKTRFTGVRLKVDLSAWRQILSGAFPMTLTIVFISFYFNADTILLAHLKGEEATGLYNASNRIIQQTRMIPALLGPAFLPALSQLAAFDQTRLKTLIRKGIFYLFTFFLPIVILVSFSSAGIISLLYGNGFSSSAPVLQLQIWAALFMILYTYIFIALMAEKRFKTLAVISGAGAILNLTLNLLLIPALSIRGAAISILVSEFSVLAGTVIVLQRVVGVRLRSLTKSLAYPAAAGLAMALCWFILAGWDWKIVGPFSGAVFVGVLLGLKGIPKEDRQLWKAFLLRKNQAAWLEAKSES